MVFLLISVIFSNVVAYIVPKHMTRIEVYSTALFSLSLGLTVDMVLDVYLNVYGYLEEGFQFTGLVTNVGLFPAMGILFLNFYPAQKGLFKKTFYFIMWTAFSLLYEWAALISGFFHHSGWNLWYSAFTYPLLLWLLLLHRCFIQKKPV
ncbi:CBO0543 family protein [Terrihalobacillus insolitus]|uniref:CBO0543 family protein n=1 Tax=Terrihalobacillus insolitus TaxID=2950438 RepID=UPI00233F945B|nr:CBO0543 family protein [Terrihalobacillus insolitus]MDC3413582.1 hypothetical protein [Terrihalobacillus insolitus]